MVERSVCVYTSRTYILCFAPGLERHDNTGGVVVSQILHLAKFLGQERESEQVMFLCQGFNTSSSLFPGPHQEVGLP